MAQRLWRETQLPKRRLRLQLLRKPEEMPEGLERHCIVRSQ